MNQEQVLSLLHNADAKLTEKKYEGILCRACAATTLCCEIGGWGTEWIDREAWKHLIDAVKLSTGDEEVDGILHGRSYVAGILGAGLRDSVMDDDLRCEAVCALVGQLRSMEPVEDVLIALEFACPKFLVEVLESGREQGDEEVTATGEGAGEADGLGGVGDIDDRAVVRDELECLVFAATNEGSSASKQSAMRLLAMIWRQNPKLCKETHSIVLEEARRMVNSLSWPAEMESAAKKEAARAGVFTLAAWGTLSRGEGCKLKRSEREDEMGDDEGEGGDVKLVQQLVAIARSRDSVVQPVASYAMEALQGLVRHKVVQELPRVTLRDLTHMISTLSRESDSDSHDGDVARGVVQVLGEIACCGSIDSRSLLWEESVHKLLVEEISEGRAPFVALRTIALLVADPRVAMWLKENRDVMGTLLETVERTVCGEGSEERVYAFHLIRALGAVFLLREDLEATKSLAQHTANAVLREECDKQERQAGLMALVTLAEGNPRVVQEELGVEKLFEVARFGLDRAEEGEDYRVMVSQTLELLAAMPILEDVRDICDRLRGERWGKFLLSLAATDREEYLQPISMEAYPMMTRSIASAAAHCIQSLCRDDAAHRVLVQGCSIVIGAIERMHSASAADALAAICIDKNDAARLLEEANIRKSFVAAMDSERFRSGDVKIAVLGALRRLLSIKDMLQRVRHVDENGCLLPAGTDSNNLRSRLVDSLVSYTRESVELNEDEVEELTLVMQCLEILASGCPTISFEFHTRGVKGYVEGIAQNHMHPASSLALSLQRTVSPDQAAGGGEGRMGGEKFPFPTHPMLPPHKDPRFDMNLDHYEVVDDEREVRGSYGGVIRVKHRLWGTVYALKIVQNMYQSLPREEAELYDDACMGSRRTLAASAKEVGALERLRNIGPFAHVVRTHWHMLAQIPDHIARHLSRGAYSGFRRPDGSGARTMLILMDCYDLTLKDYVKRVGKCHDLVVVDWAQQIHVALSHLREATIVHRDIKPNNIMVNLGATSRRSRGNGQIVIVDFGEAIVLNRLEGVDKDALAELRVPARFFPHSNILLSLDPRRGNLGFGGNAEALAPEVRSAQDVASDTSTDFVPFGGQHAYELGAMLFFLLTGEQYLGKFPPFGDSALLTDTHGLYALTNDLVHPDPNERATLEKAGLVLHEVASKLFVDEGAGSDGGGAAECGKGGGEGVVEG